MFYVDTPQKINRCSYYFALEEYLLKNNQNEEYFFLWNIEKSLVVGRHQLIYDELNIAQAQSDQVNIYRRPSGGGAVYADENCLMFSFITPNFDKEMVFKTYLDKMITAFAKMGIKATFSGRNDLLIDGKKFSGNAFYRLHNCACLHGTLLFDTDLSRMGKYLTPNVLKLGSKGISSVQSRVVNIRPFYHKTKDEFIKELILHLSLQRMVLTPLMDSLVREGQKKYEEDSYIFRKTSYSKKLATYSKAGVIDFNFTLVNHQIQSCKISGDFFEKQALKEAETFFVNQPYTFTSIQETLLKVKLENYIYDFDLSSILQALKNYFEG